MTLTLSSHLDVNSENPTSSVVGPNATPADVYAGMPTIIHIIEAHRKMIWQFQYQFPACPLHSQIMIFVEALLGMRISKLGPDYLAANLSTTNSRLGTSKMVRKCQRRCSTSAPTLALNLRGPSWEGEHRGLKHWGSEVLHLVPHKLQMIYVYISNIYMIVFRIEMDGFTALNILGLKLNRSEDRPRWKGIRGAIWTLIFSYMPYSCFENFWKYNLNQLYILSR